jgi:uncharacterized small protein (DUF1192 family)
LSSTPTSPDLAALEHELEQLKQQLPRHSISPSIQARIDELEERIAALKHAPTQDSAESK